MAGAKESSSAVSLLAAVIVAVAGLVPVVWLTSSPDGQSVTDGEVVADVSTTTSPASAAIVVEPVPQLEVDELDPSLVRVLQANGYAELAGQPYLEDALTPAVSRVLIDSGAVLTVVEEAPLGEEG